MGKINLRSHLDPEQLSSRLVEGANLNVSFPQFSGRRPVYLNQTGSKFMLGRRIGYRDSLSTTIHGEILKLGSGSEIIGYISPGRKYFIALIAALLLASLAFAVRFVNIFLKGSAPIASSAIAIPVILLALVLYSWYRRSQDTAFLMRYLEACCEKDALEGNTSKMV